MSEHSKGRLHQCEHSDKRLRDNGGKWVADVDTPYRNSEECADNARRIAAVWNNAEGMTTQEIEQGMPLVKARDTINAQARELAASIERTTKLEALVAERDAMLGKRPCQNSRCNELNAARALLREAFSEIDRIADADHELSDRMKSYLDACDTLEGK